MVFQARFLIIGQVLKNSSREHQDFFSFHIPNLEHVSCEMRVNLIVCKLNEFFSRRTNYGFNALAIIGRNRVDSNADKGFTNGKHRIGVIHNPIISTKSFRWARGDTAA